MLLRRLAPIAAIIFAFAGAPPAAQACSTSEDYVVPSNFELAQLADAIVVATAGPSPREVSPIIGSVTFVVTQTLKGTPPRAVDIEWASIGPGGGIGMCSRSGFEAGRPYLLFLARGSDGQWGRLGFPFSPDAADYDGPDGVWTRTVRRYLALQQGMAPMEQLAAMAAMAGSGMDEDRRPLSADERADVLRHLRSISPWKPTAWLLDMHARVERGDPLPFGAGVPEEDGHDAYGRAAAALLGDDSPDTAAGAQAETAAVAAIDPRRILILRALAVGEHADAIPFFERLWSAPEVHPQERGLTLRFLARNGQYARTYRWIETHLLPVLARLPRDEALALLEHVADVQRGDSWEEGQERWRSDPHAAATWPALSRALHHYQLRRFGEGDALPFFDVEEDEP